MQQPQRALDQFAVRNHNERQASVVRRQTEHICGDRLFGLTGDDGQRTVRLDHPILDIRDRGDILFAQGFDHLVGCQAHLAQFLDVQLPAAYDDGGLTVEQPPERAAFERQKAQKDLEYNQRGDRHQTGYHRDAEVLHGDRSQIGDQNGHDQLGGIELADLPFAHQPDGGNHSAIQQQRAQQGNCHSR